MGIFAMNIPHADRNVCTCLRPVDGTGTCVVIDWGNNSIRCLQSVKRNAYEAAPKLWRVSTLVGDGQAAVVDGEGVSCLPPLSVLWGGGLRGKKQRQQNSWIHVCEMAWSCI